VVTDRPRSRSIADVSAHPHGFLGYVVSDDKRTRNFVRLLRWPTITMISATAVVVFSLSAMPTAVSVALATGLSTTIAGTGVKSWRRWKQRRRS
jgi:hypothetical protein